VIDEHGADSRTRAADSPALDGAEQPPGDFPDAYGGTTRLRA
jgi:hypothetical protein